MLGTMMTTFLLFGRHVSETGMSLHLGNRRRRRSRSIPSGRDADHGDGGAVVVAALLVVVRHQRFSFKVVDDGRFDFNHFCRMVFLSDDSSNLARKIIKISNSLKFKFTNLNPIFPVSC